MAKKMTRNGIGSTVLPTAHNEYLTGCSSGVQNRLVMLTNAGLFVDSKRPSRKRQTAKWVKFLTACCQPAAL